MASLTRTMRKTMTSAAEKFRPAPPENLVNRIVGYLSERLSTPFDTAVDVGCGHGRSTEALSPYFKNVIGFNSSDVKENYNFKGHGLYNIIYSQGTAEHIGCLDKTVQLVTASQCAHWFNLRKFFLETGRVLSPGGVLAIYGYLLPTCGQHMTEANDVINELMIKTLGEYMPNQSKILYIDRYRSKEYESFVFNKEPIERDESKFVEFSTTISDLVHYIRNTATFQNYESINGKASGNDLLRKFQQRIMEIHGGSNPDKAELKVIFNFILLLGRKPF